MWTEVICTAVSAAALVVGKRWGHRAEKVAAKALTAIIDEWSKEWTENGAIAPARTPAAEPTPIMTDADQSKLELVFSKLTDRANWLEGVLATLIGQTRVGIQLDGSPFEWRLIEKVLPDGRFGYGAERVDGEPLATGLPGVTDAVAVLKMSVDDETGDVTIRQEGVAELKMTAAEFADKAVREEMLRAAKFVYPARPGGKVEDTNGS